MFTYVVQGPPLSPVKIGKALDWQKRLASLQTASPHELRLLLLLDYDCEYELHLRFKKHRSRGEWFCWCDEIREFISDLRGLPAPWCQVNAYCTNDERRLVNEWHGNLLRSVLDSRDWVCSASMRLGVETPPSIVVVTRLVGQVPWLQ